ncbi:lysyl-tRNA synthetase [Salinisphaera orenii MK-B5]|uniref:Lysyl-tRNA synthetase n=1 Tax=Salinisphaera orenii MK-B5 TaxID=856730 RepID=A0A423PP70_9GAMM|nr:EF-P lysine aminoacylase EpmA [Salinisphaera orenii]ROO27380.1 lysyl-tRNA synthetase [Salinisphaera orenii MK-B5]
MTDEAPSWRPSATRETLARRAALFADVRRFMAERGVMEVDTGVIGRAPPAERGLDALSVAGAGWLAPSPEHALKRLLAAGSGAIYQLGHVFRAGESGRWHNPEFCMLEWYRPGARMADVVEETAALLAAVAGTSVVERVRYRDVFREHVGLDPLAAGPAALARAADERGVAPPGAPADSRVFWLDLLMSVVVQPRLGRNGPVCVSGFPADDAVLVEIEPADARISRRFEIYWQGVELANGAQELTDPERARAAMARENEAREAAGAAPVPTDTALLAAMDHGLPASAGVALGVDRLLALMLGHDGIGAVLPFAWARR